MKKINLLITLIVLMFVSRLTVMAASATLSVSSDSVEVGDSFTVSVKMVDAAAWDVKVNAVGPVDDCKINDVNATDDGKNTSKTFSTTCTTNGVGTVTLTLSGDITTVIGDIDSGNFSDENKTISGNVAVTVKEKTIPETKPVTPTNNDDKKEEKSTNNKLKDLVVEGHSLEKVDDSNYTLTVLNNVSSVNIKVTPEDAKSKVTGDGNKELKVGENLFEIVITSESGKKNKITLKITRKDGYELKDLEEILKDDKLDAIDITIDSNSIISKDILSKIKDSKKKIVFNYYDDNKKVLYSVTIDGSKVQDVSDLDIGILNKSENSDIITKLSNNAVGLQISIKNKLPNGTLIKMYVGDKFKNGEIVKVYYYDKDNNKLKVLNSGLRVTNGYIEFAPEEYSDYLIAKELSGDTTCTDKGNKTILILIILVILLAIAFITVSTILLIKIRKDKRITNKDNYTNQKSDKDILINDSDYGSDNIIVSSNK